MIDHHDPAGADARETSIKGERAFRFVMILLATFFAVAVAGCVFSPSPVFPINDGIVDTDLKGRYTVTKIGDDFLIEKKYYIPMEFELFIKESTYLVVDKDAIAYFAVICRLNEEFRVVQIRRARENVHLYAVLLKIATGFELARIRCDSPVWPCDAKTKDNVLRLATATVESFRSRPSDILIAEKR